MKRLLRTAALLLALPVPAIASEQIGDIEFFGYKGLNLANLRNAVTLHEGDGYSDRTKGEVREAVAAFLGKEPTDVAAICCDGQRRRLLFVGLPGHPAEHLSTIPSQQARNACLRPS